MASAGTRSMGGTEWALLVTLSVLWGGTFFFQAVAVRALPPFSIVFLRVAGAALVLHLVLLARGERLPGDRASLMAFAGMGLLNNALPFSLIVWGQAHLPRETASGLAAILNATTPLFGVVVAHFLTEDEKLGPGRIAGVVLGFAGVAVMLGPGLLHGIGDGTLAPLACLAAALIYAFAGVFGRRFRRMGIAPVAGAAGQVSASALLLAPLALAVDRPWTLPWPGAGVWLALAGLAVLSTALAYVLYFRLLATAGATNLLLVTFLIPVTAILLGVFTLSESLAPRHFVGMGLIACGLACIDGRLARLLRPRRQPA